MKEIKNEQILLCACGCGEPVKFNKSKKRWNKFIKGHYVRTLKTSPNHKKSNKLIYQDDVLTKFLIESPKHGNFEVLIDTEDYNKIKNYRWVLYNCKNNSYYTSARKSKTKISLHRIIMNIIDKKIFIDHINHNTLDNRKINLRICNNGENMRNSRKCVKTTSIYKGVSLHKQTNRFSAYIQFNKKRQHLGTFKYEINAARAYNTKAKELFNEFAYLNDLSDIKKFPEEPKRKIKTSIYIGVSKEKNKYRAQITINNKGIYIGSFVTEIEAARAYNDYIIKHNIPNRKLNTIKEI